MEDGESRRLVDGEEKQKKKKPRHRCWGARVQFPGSHTGVRLRSYFNTTVGVGQDGFGKIGSVMLIGGNGLSFIRDIVYDKIISNKVTLWCSW